MKKIFVIALLGIVGFTGCTKKHDQISQVVTASFPTITLTGPPYYSIPVGGALPTVSATAYDSFYKETPKVTIDNSTLDNSTPGLYIVQVKAKNHLGYIGSAIVYIAVTNVPAAENLAGVYKRTSNSVLVNVTKVGNGMYLTDNFGGVDTTVSPGANYSAVFVQTGDTTLDFGGANGQPTGAGTLIITNLSFTASPGDTSFSYVVNASGFGTSQRTFIKQ